VVAQVIQKLHESVTAIEDSTCRALTGRRVK